MTADPLEVIDSINWSTLNHAYGSAQDVPDILRCLRSKDDKARKDAYYELYGNIYHQGTRYSASVAAIPFLYALLEAEDTPHREQLLDLLVNLAVGFPSSFIPGGVNIKEWRAHIAEMSQLNEDAMKEESENDESDLSDESNLGDDSSEGESDREENINQVRLEEFKAYEAVQKGFNAIYRFLGDPEVAVRAMAAYSLAFFPERFEENRTLLLHRLDIEKNPVVRGTALVALAVLCNSCPVANLKSSTLALLIKHCNEESPERFTRWIRALTRIIVGRPDPEIVQEVLQRVTDEGYFSQDEPTEYTFPFAPSGLLDFVTSTLSDIKGTEHPYAPQMVAQKLEKSDANAYTTLTEISANMALDGILPTPLPVFANLSDLQQEMVTAIWKSSLEGNRKLPFSFRVMFTKREPPTSQDFEDYITAK